MPTNPFDQFDVSASNPFDQFDTPVAGSTFKSGSAFDDTKKLLTKPTEGESAIDEFKRMWKTDKVAALELPIARVLSAGLHANPARMITEGPDKHDKEAQSAAVDILGALPSMVGGAAMGVGTALKDGSASSGLTAAQETMHKLTPSTLLGREEDQKSGLYNNMMAPFTGIMDTLNAIPQGYGEMLHAMGHDDAAAQVSDAGKLGIMAAMGVMGAKEAYHAATGKKAPTKEQLKIEDPRDAAKANPFDKFDTTQAHADDFAAVNPYDMGGHVTASDQGHPTTIDNPQGELFGGQHLDQSPTTPVSPDSMVNTPAIREVPPNDGMVSNPAPTEPTAMGHAMVDAQKDAAFRQKAAEEAAKKQAEMDAAYGEHDRKKQSDFAMMEAQRELDHMNTAHEVENSPARNFFTDPASRDKLDLQTTRAYHGTSSVFDELRPTTQGQFGPGIYTTLDHAEAGKYANAGEGGHPNIRPVDVDLKNPLVIEADVSSGHPRNWFKKDGFNAPGDPHNRNIVEKLKALGHDGIIAKQPEVLGLNPDGSLKLGKVQTHHVAFESDSVKSIFRDHQFAGENLGDKTLMHPEATHSMVEALSKGDIHGALDSIVKNHIDPAYRHLAEYLKGVIGDVKVRMHDEGILSIGDRHATGYYDPATHTVGLSKVGAVSPHTLMHELVHSITSAFVNERPGDLRVMGLKDLFTKLQEMGMDKEFPNVSNVKEFLAEAFSNPEFQGYLKEHRLNTRSTFSRFVDGVKSILGISSSTRIGVVNALDHVLDLGKQIAEVKDDPKAPLRDAGMPGKLADLMVTRRPEPVNAVVTNENMRALGKLGKIVGQFDFTPLKPEQIIEMAKTADDIPKGAIETLRANLDAGGRMASLRHNNNPVVKYTFAHIDQAVKNYEAWIRTNITDAKTGIKAMLRGLSGEEFATVHQQLMLDEGVLERTPQQMRQLGWSENMITLAQKIRATDLEMLDKVNAARARMNPPMPPIDRRIGHLAGRFLGDFYHTVYELKKDANGNVVRDAQGTAVRTRAIMMITDSTSRGARHLAEFIQKQHPEWEVDQAQSHRAEDEKVSKAEVSDQQYRGIKASKNSDRFSGFMEMMSFIADKDPEVAKALDSLDKYNRNAATNYMNQLRHAKEKVRQPGGVIGSEGHKEYTGNYFSGVSKVDVIKNAEEGFRGHLAYLDTSAKWVEMQHAMENISKVTTDKEVALQQKNAIQWSTAYTDHALHRNQGWLTDFANSLLSEVGRVTGVGHTNLKKGVNAMSTFEMRNWMGIGNIPFAVKHLILPFQKMPAMMAYMHTSGGLSPIRQSMAGLKSLSSYYHYLKDTPDVTPFEKTAFKYAKDNNVFGVNLDNISGRIQAGRVRQALGKFADADFSGPEHAIRGNSFFFYAHLLNDAGVPVQSALSAAEHLTKFLYTDYAPHEAPRGAAKAGWIGQLALQVTRYKANELSQLGFFGREGIKDMKAEDHSFMQKLTSNAPLMTHMASLLAFTGVTGMLAFKEMDDAYSAFRKYVMRDPDNLTALLQRSKASELVKYGLFSKLGIDAKIDEKQLLPSPFPTTAAEINQLGLAFNMARHRDAWSAKQFGLSMTPSTFRGPVENHFFTQPPVTRGPNAGKSLYLNPNTGEGRVWRSPEEQKLRNFGYHSIAETDKVDNNYAMQRIKQDHVDIAKHIIDHAKSLIASGSFNPATSKALAQEYAKHQQANMPSFASEIQSYNMKRNMDQREQMELSASKDRQMGNTLSTIVRNK